MTEQGNLKAVEKSLADMTKPLARAPERIIPEKSFAPMDHRGIHELLTEVSEMLERSASIVKLAQQRLTDFQSLQDRFYQGNR